MKIALYLVVMLLSLFSLRGGEGDALILCENSAEMVEYDLQLIAEASQSIEFSPCLTGGAIFQRFMEAFEERLKVCPQLQAYVLACPLLLEVKDQDTISRLRAIYPERFHFQFTDNVYIPPLDYSGVDNHVKCLIVDEKYYSVGGTNFDENYCGEGIAKPDRREGEGIARRSIPGGMRDEDTLGRGPLAIELRHIFYKLYALWESYMETGVFNGDPEAFAQNNSYFPLVQELQPTIEAFESSPLLIESIDAKLLLSGPCEVENSITAAYVEMIRAAKEEIVLGHLHFNPTEPIFEALVEAQKRGVRVKLVTNGTHAEAAVFSNLFCWANRSNYVRLMHGKEFRFWEKSGALNTPLLNNAEIYEYVVDDTLYHKKVMVVDGVHCIIGSYNLGLKSATNDFELVLVTHSARFGQDLLKVIERDITFSLKVPPEQAIEWYFDVSLSYLARVQKLFHGFV